MMLCVESSRGAIYTVITNLIVPLPVSSQPKAYVLFEPSVAVAKHGDLSSFETTEPARDIIGILGLVQWAAANARQPFASRDWLESMTSWTL